MEKQKHVIIALPLFALEIQEKDESIQLNKRNPEAPVFVGVNAVCSFGRVLLSRRSEPKVYVRMLPQ